MIEIIVLGIYRDKLLLKLIAFILLYFFKVATRKVQLSYDIFFL